MTEPVQPQRPAPMPPNPRIDQTISLIALGLIVAGCFVVLRPFLGAIVWAAILSATTWPLFVRLRARLRGHTGVASLVMVVLISVTLLAPFVIVGVTLADNAKQLMALLQRFVASGPPAPPEWVAQLPLFGSRLSDYWGGFAHDTARLLEELGKVAEPARRLALSGGTSVLASLLQLALSILIAFFFFRDGDAILARLRTAGERIAGDRARRLLAVATETTRGVVLGILGTALVQGVLMGVGAWIAGMNTAPLLGFLVFLLSPVPVGPPLIWGSAAALLIAQGETGWGMFMLVWGLGLVSTVDNIIRPLIISKGGALPFILVLIGIFGGIAAFGFIGIFLGPVLIAVGFMLLKEWAPAAPPPATSASEVGPADLAPGDDREP
jgi:predicted PurR-regulated permease PerM